jgi:hypothetical protein
VSKVRLYFDEDAEEDAVVGALRARDIDVLTTVEAGRFGADDADQLEFAVREGRAIYTFNVRHFSALHNEWLTHSREHRGIVVLRHQRLPVGEKIRRLARLIASVSAEEMINRIEYLQ